MRRRLRLPPFAHLVQCTVLAGSRDRAAEAAQRLAEQLKRAGRRRKITVMGPAPDRIARLRRTYRMCVLLKAGSREPMLNVLWRVLQPGRKFRGLPVLVDVDPL